MNRLKPERLTYIGDRLRPLADTVSIDEKVGLKVSCSPEKLLVVAKALKEAGFDHVVSVTGVDWPKQGKLDAVWHLSSYSDEELAGGIAQLSCYLSRENPTVPSLATVWESATFQEREAFEMFGIEFQGHPDLRQLFLPEELKGVWPLRKDFELKKRRDEFWRPRRFFQ